MAQEVVFGAELFKTGLNSVGHIEGSGLFFDTGRAEIKSESEVAIAEIAKLLKNDAGLKVFVVGHTNIQHNQVIAHNWQLILEICHDCTRWQQPLAT